ncbi:MAG TPA: VOC family protein [Polyangia bacterium]|nr:VOC family protein [Polyangia bacterium]
MTRRQGPVAFRYATIYVADVGATLAFFEQAFELRAHFVHDSGRYAELDTGATKLAFAAHALAREVVGAPYAETKPERPPPGFEIGLSVDDLDAALARAQRAGAAVVKPPTRMPWGQTIAYLRDPDGVLLVLVEGA